MTKRDLYSKVVGNILRGMLGVTYVAFVLLSFCVVYMFSYIYSTVCSEVLSLVLSAVTFVLIIKVSLVSINKNNEKVAHLQLTK